jgi:hypothetical protein
MIGIESEPFGNPLGKVHKNAGEKSMNHNLVKPVIRFCSVIVLLGWASWATAVPKPPMGTAHSMEVTVANNVGDSILGDGGVYTNGVDGATARIWDYDPPAADRLTFGAGSTRLKLVIDEGAVNADCLVGTLFVNESSIPGFQFYNDPTFPVGDSTTVADEDNYGGTFRCNTDKRGKTGWFVHWKPIDQCIVISHTAADTYTFTAGAGCLADVSQIVNGSVQPPLGAYDVPFQLVATELP